MKPLFTLFIVFLSLFTNAQAKDKKTIIDRIKEADSIPVYIVHGRVEPGKYNWKVQQVCLSVWEKNRKFMRGVMPSDVDTNAQAIVDLLNSEFHTTKFYIGATGIESEIVELTKNDTVSFFVFAKFTAEYKYADSVARRDIETYELMAALDLWLRCSVNFHIPSDEKPVQRLSGTNAGIRTQIEMGGFVNSADGFMAIKSPLTLIKSMLESLEEKMAAYAKNQYEIQYKAVSKRK